jgi:hypothetical protein
MDYQLWQHSESSRIGQPCSLQRCPLADTQYVKQAAGQGSQALYLHPLAAATAAASDTSTSIYAAASMCCMKLPPLTALELRPCAASMPMSSAATTCW